MRLNTLVQDVELPVIQAPMAGVQDEDLALAVSTAGGLGSMPCALLEPDRRYDVRLRVVLDMESFPGPLRLLAFWRRDWSIASDWYRWRLEKE